MRQDLHLIILSTLTTASGFAGPSMPEFDKTQVEKYLSQVLDALAKGDKVALKRFGQQDGFVDNRIRTLVWYLPRRARE